MKRLFIMAISLLVAGVANAQNSGVRFGAKAGANFSNIIKTGDDDFETEYKTGLHAGLFLEIPVIDRLSFAPELMYSQKGYKNTSDNILFGQTEYSVTTNFIEVPILAKIQASNSFSVHLGPQVSFLTSTTESFKQGSDEFRRTIQEDNDNLKKSLFGGVVGVGFDLNPKLGLNARYALDFQENNENGTSETPVYKNQVFQVGLGLKL